MVKQILTLISIFILGIVFMSCDRRDKEHINKVLVGISLTGFKSPFGITIDNEENLYISDFGAHKVLVYDKDHNLVKEINPGKNILHSPHSVAFDSDGNLYITDYTNKKIQKFSKEGEFLQTIINDKYIKGPATSYFDIEGNLLVSDYSSNSVMKFTSEGTFLGWIGAKKDGSITDGWETYYEERSVSTINGGFDRLHYALNDSSGNIYVADTWNHRIQKFSKTGKFIGWIGEKEEGSIADGWTMDGSSKASNNSGGFNAPVALYITDEDEIYVFDYKGGRVQRFSKEGKFIELVIDGFHQGYDIKVNNNKLYVVDTHFRRIQVIDL
ncbi:MAG: NHL repeat-containing protein [Campylobacterales bacterium]|nr:NHL repeat-containing protein [Campylobacterales bacterium]